MSKYDWMIHFVCNTVEFDDEGNKIENNIFRKYMCDAHTHGLDKYGSLELQIVLAVGPELIGYTLNTIGEMVRDGFTLEDGMLIDGLFENGVKAKIFETTDCEGVPIFRVILPDREFRFPEDSDEEGYCMQYKSPYLSQLN